MMELISSGFKAVVVALNTEFLPEDDLGRVIDEGWIDHIKDLNRKREGTPITYCGESGEYHTFVFDGPAFRKPILFNLGEKVRKDTYRLIDIIPAK